MADVVLVDDHVLLRNGLACLIAGLGHRVLFEASNGKEFIEILDANQLPDIVLLDINMPEMDGNETANWIRSKHPTIKVLALSMYDNEGAIIKMLKNGAKGYILKDSNPTHLKLALNDLMTKGYYHSDLVSGRLINAINSMNSEGKFVSQNAQLTEREVEFLKHCCTDAGYKEIASAMGVSTRTVEGYRDSLFAKLDIKSRVGLAMYALKNGIVVL